MFVDADKILDVSDLATHNLSKDAHIHDSLIHLAFYKDKFTNYNADIKCTCALLALTIKILVRFSVKVTRFSNQAYV